MINKMLIGTCILYILSLFTGNPLLLTLCLTLFIFAIIINCCELWKGRNVIGYMFDKTENNAIEGLKNKQYGRLIINVLITPIVMIGIVMVLLCMICMWSMILN